MLFYGPPGIGKTALARCVAKELEITYRREISFFNYTPLSLGGANDVIVAIKKLDKYDVMFIDEIHGLEQNVEESLYSILQDFEFCDPNGRLIKVPTFTMLGATTLLGKINKPFRDRFTINIELVIPTIEELSTIILNRGAPPTSFEDYSGQDAAKTILKMHVSSLGQRRIDDITTEVALEIASRALGNPRATKQTYEHVVAYQTLVQKPISLPELSQLFDLLGIDSLGLHKHDIRVIKSILNRGNKPIGIAALSTLSGIPKGDIEEIIEPRLELCQLLERTPRGRALTQKAIDLYG
jgi:Holliday junction DNA helicase RuvB